MERDQSKQGNDNNNISSSLLSPKHSPTKHPHPNNNNITTTNDQKLKRDEWSEGAVSSLLEAYEAKWSLRNRAKLKGQDWEDVAKYVSARAHNSKSPKTQTQCKNKIESMKKRYRSESAAGAGDASSSWPLYPRLDLLLRGNAAVAPLMHVQVANPPPVVVMGTSPPLPQPRGPLVPPPGSAAVNSHESGGVDRSAKKDGNNNGPKLSEQESHKNHIDDTDSSTAAVHADKEKSKGEKANNNTMKRRRDQGHAGEIGESIRWLAEVVVRSEQARMETMREIERIRVEAEAKRGEMDLKRTEIIANTQLEIAKLFARGSVDSS
ncbi:UNVERIFIED_CONTAM: Trihelix transcription factor ASIL2 [Sesamum radiatum]|uniref:Trihelix transcription factor ASIL2 n=1 Tax=Sesamum radiatum TaxID=300843 RepID=A0AAW2S6P8_SESRA